jgi:hypothetical protein
MPLQSSSLLTGILNFSLIISQALLISTSEASKSSSAANLFETSTRNCSLFSSLFKLFGTEHLHMKGGMLIIHWQSLTSATTKEWLVSQPAVLNDQHQVPLNVFSDQDMVNEEWRLLGC